jgi:serine/threonine protein kinase
MTIRPDKTSDPIGGVSTPFRVLREIGSGAHGSIYLAEGPFGRVALKVCPRPEAPERQADWERERRGWRLLTAIPRHPGLVRVLDSGDDPGGAFWVAMELADPEEEAASDAESYRPLTLASVAAAETALPLSKCLSIGLRLASALEHLQRHHLLHRDVKPGNILFVGGRPVIADAGLVVDVREAASSVGTPGYVPPENHGSPQGDVFSLGRTLWRIATGRPPEEAGSAPCAEADTSDPDFRDFLAIVERAMSVVPERRYRSAKAMRKALVRLQRHRRMRQVRRIALPILGAVCAVLLLALAWALGRRSATTPNVPAPLTDIVPMSPVSEPDPLDEIREGIRSGKIHVMTKEEARGIVNGALGNLNNALADVTNSLPSTR